MSYAALRSSFTMRKPAEPSADGDGPPGSRVFSKGIQIVNSTLTPKSKLSRKAAAVVLGCGLGVATFGGLAGVAGASTNHNSSISTNNGCSYDGYHKYTNGSSATADTEKKSGNCVEVSVRLWRSGSSTSINHYHPTKAIASVSGSITFVSSDHNADPLGTPPYVGFNMK